jgi:hypothetical protein
LEGGYKMAGSLAFAIGVVAGFVLAFFVFRVNPKLLGGLEWLNKKVEEFKAKVK